MKPSRLGVEAVDLTYSFLLPVGDYHMVPHPTLQDQDQFDVTGALLASQVRMPHISWDDIFH